MPVFGRHGGLSGRSFRVVYADDDPNQVIHDELADSDDLGALPPKAGLLGAGAVEIAKPPPLRPALPSERRRPASATPRDCFRVRLLRKGVLSGGFKTMGYASELLAV
jgi:hypothetical protein